MRLILIALSLFLFITSVSVRADNIAKKNEVSLALVNGNHTHVLDVNVMIGDVSFDVYWNGVLDELFAFADVDRSGAITDNEVHLLPSARALRLALGSGFTPPVASLHSVRQLGSDPAQGCTNDELQRYYRKSGAASVRIGHADLPHSNSLADALIAALDEDRNGNLSQQELANAESSLRKFDTNDDELISAEELVPNQLYPGCAATNPVDRIEDAKNLGTVHWVAIDNESADQMSVNPSSLTRRSWNVTLRDAIHDNPLMVTSKDKLAYEAWSVTGPLAKLCDDFAKRIGESPITANAGEMASEPTMDSRGREKRNQFAWLVPMVDRNFDGIASPVEIADWLNIQRKIAHGQLFISVLSSGGLFERLDLNHDSGLSVRELRNAWTVLEAAGCTQVDQLDLKRISGVGMVIASRGYPDRIAKSHQKQPEWFRLMDRNSDGDISRREFTEPTERFIQLDQDHDNLISVSEALDLDIGSE